MGRSVLKYVHIFKDDDKASVETMANSQYH